MSQNQLKGRVLERIAYDVLKHLVMSRLVWHGTEKSVDNGTLWLGRNYSIFWNWSVKQTGPHSNGQSRQRLADLVLCDRTMTPKLSGKYRTAVLAVELKNMNLDYKWPKAWMFYRDVVGRFITGNPYTIPKVLSDPNWEQNAGSANLYPNAIRVFITPKFAYLPSALKASGAAQSERDQIRWAIKRLNLKVRQLGYQPKPRAGYPAEEVWVRMRHILNEYVDELHVKR